MADGDDEDDNIPLLEDIVRPGNVEPAKGQRPSSTGPEKADQGDMPVTQEEIEAIAARVVERHIDTIEQAVTRAIRTAIRLKGGRWHKE